MISLLLYKFASDVTTACPKTSTNYCGLPTAAANSSTIHTLLQIVLGILGSIALLVIVIAGLRYITSAGDPQKAAHARSTIIFALVGLIIAISAEAIITFVVTRL